MKEEVVIVQGTFNDIYGWGQGFYTREKYHAWEDSLANIKSCFWEVKKSQHCRYLVGVHGSIYMHPMGFNAVLHSVGSGGDSFSCGDLEEICKCIAKDCEGSFHMYVSKPMVIEAELVPYTKGVHNTLTRR